MGKLSEDAVHVKHTTCKDHKRILLSQRFKPCFQKLVGLLTWIQLEEIILGHPNILHCWNFQGSTSIIDRCLRSQKIAHID
ncbi:hypothetical protein AAZX31_15G101300 [Glycine max]